MKHYVFPLNVYVVTFNLNVLTLFSPRLSIWVWLLDYRGITKLWSSQTSISIKGKQINHVPSSLRTVLFSKTSKT